MYMEDRLSERRLEDEGLCHRRLVNRGSDVRTLLCVSRIGGTYSVTGIELIGL